MRILRPVVQVPASLLAGLITYLNHIPLYGAQQANHVILVWS